MLIFGNRRKPDEEDTPDMNDSQPTNIAVSQSFQTVLGAGTKLEGELICEGNIRMDGEFKGTLILKGNVLVGEAGIIHSDLHAQNISIAGKVYGDVQGKKVQILRTGSVQGDITAVSLATEEGAIIDGKISMTKDIPEEVEEETDD